MQITQFLQLRRLGTMDVAQNYKFIYYLHYFLIYFNMVQQVIIIAICRATQYN